MSAYTRFGDVITINKEFGIPIDSLPGEAFTVSQTPTGEYFLSASDELSIPSKLYGETETRAKHVISTYKRRCGSGNNTGVLLSGTKGSGKTMLAKVISNQLIKEGVPTILINCGYHDPNFIDFINGIDDRAVILIDEFDKTYSKKEAQEGLLSLLDGTGRGNKLFILTKNNGFISEFFLNRPSRVFYNFNYDKLSKRTMDDYLAYNLNGDNHIESFERLHDVSVELSFDVVQGIVEELNAYPELEFKECLDMMGISFGESGSWKIESVTVNNHLLEVDYDNMYIFDPMRFLNNNQKISIEFKNVSDKVYNEVSSNRHVKTENEGEFRMIVDGGMGKVNMSGGGKVVIEDSDRDGSFKVVFERERNINSFSHLFKKDAF